MREEILELLKIHIILIIVIIISNIYNFRICLFYNIFKIPCIGCGLTRGILSIIKGKFYLAIKYNFLSIVIFLGYFIILIWNIYDMIMKKQTLKKFIKNNTKIIVIISIILAIIAWIININNEMLY